MKDYVYNLIDKKFINNKKLVKKMVAYSITNLFSNILLFFSLISLWIILVLTIISLFCFKWLNFKGSTIILISSLLISIIIFILSISINRLLKKSYYKLIKLQFINNDLESIYKDSFAKVCNNKDISLVSLKLDNELNNKLLSTFILYQYKDFTGKFTIHEPIQVFKTTDVFDESTTGNSLLFMLIVYPILRVFLKNKYLSKETISMNKSIIKEDSQNILFLKKETDKNFFYSKSSLDESKINNDDLIELKKKLDNNIKKLSKEFNFEVKINNEIIFSKARTLNKTKINQVGILNYNKIKSYKSFINELCKKVIYDLNSFLNSLDFIENL
ncbi:hypothetical protein [Spiroplasma turonicum]|uniref:DUF3137 domain-containing protein n=1 Tax=Spiroplasma turonicum TaxID=216946 RepID=A0A0K1P8E7_9MOLU|nr:hypothetical protein [Spiroplasma turonicum]AKU80172.1 hypothetical protein STURON_00926 [Spiroplasma turonicum]ALX71172.1 hypothetical protein STURO_v1c09210 [Spiroplasma turonicum]